MNMDFKYITVDVRCIRFWYSQYIPYNNNQDLPVHSGPGAVEKK